MPLWLDLLRTPMAAPETRALKSMRMTILVACGLLVGSIAALAPLRAAIGNVAGGMIAAELACPSPGRCAATLSPEGREDKERPVAGW